MEILWLLDLTWSANPPTRASRRVFTLPAHPARPALSSVACWAVQPRPQQVFGDDLPDSQDGEQPGPSRRKRQPSMSETMPLYTLCKEDLESMDKEVDDILGEGSDDSDSEKKPREEEEPPEEELGHGPPEALEAPRGRRLERGLRGHKRKLNEEDAASESSGASSCEDEEGGSSEADEMAAALEAELGDLM
ncbi:hypothetical protein K5549_007322 [Capra hircus]|nr:hypothetical protein K5549_007322 [Capra hircus]